MVLQQGAKIPVWGWAVPGEAVTVRLGGGSATAKAGADGSWRVDLDKMTAGPAALTMTVSGKNTLKFEDVLVGDVWVCSGQSNMEFSLGRAQNGAAEAPKATDQQLRFFHVIHKVAMEPGKDFVKGVSWDACPPDDRWKKVGGEWVVCNPRDASIFTAVGYFFGAELRRTVHEPVGLIESAWGGTSCEWWVSESALRDNVGKDPGFQGMLDTLARVLAGYGKMLADYPKVLAVYQADDAKWQAEVGATWTPLNAAWKTAVFKAKQAGSPLPPQPKPSRPEPRAPVNPAELRVPSTVFNGMIAPLIPYGIKGVIWYQGENNHAHPLQYRTLFKLLITDWRQQWGEGDFPFLFVQLSNNSASGYSTPVPYQKDDDWPGTREAQTMALSLPNTGMAVTIDIGDGREVHPRDKYDVGIRLALAAKKVAYGMDVVASGPTFASMKIEGNKARISFTNTGGGLLFAAPPWDARGQIETPTELLGFTIAGADKKFVWANAKIDGTDVLIWSDAVPAPKAVRYAWFNSTGFARCNLYNKEMLPAVPFRTDDW